MGGWEREDPREPKHSSFYPQPPALKHRGGGHQRTRVHSLPIMTMSWYSSPRDPSPSLAILIKHSPQSAPVLVMLLCPGNPPIIVNQLVFSAQARWLLPVRQVRQ